MSPSAQLRRAKARAAAAVLATTLLTGCAASGPIYVDAPPPPDGDALVYIYRNKSSASQMNDAHFFVDDTKVADLSPGGYTWFHIRSGSYVLTQKWGALSLRRDLALRVRWQPGRTYYYRFEVAGEFWVVAQRITWQIAEVSADEALPKLRERRLQPAFDLDKIWGNVPPELRPRDGDRR